MNILLISLLVLTPLSTCSSSTGPFPNEDDKDEPLAFKIGVDLSYVNQILDHSGVYKMNGEETNHYEIFGLKRIMMRKEMLCRS